MAFPGHSDERHLTPAAGSPLLGSEPADPPNTSPTSRSDTSGWAPDISPTATSNPDLIRELGFRTLNVALAVGISAVAAFAKMTAAGLPDPGPAIPTRNVRWATAAGRDRRVLAPRPKPVVVWQISDTVGVLRAGSLVESGPADRVLLDPHHEYTEELLAAIAGNRAPIDFAGGPQRTEGVPMSPAGRQRQYCHA